MAGAVKHPEVGKHLDISKDVNLNAKIEDASVFLYPVHAYGDPQVLRRVLEIEKPDEIYNVDLNKTGTRPLNRIPQSIGLVMFGDYVPPVSELLLRKIDRKLQSISNAGGLVFETLQNGDPVDIISGAFEGYQAIFEERISGDDRVRVLLKMLSDRYVPVELEAGAIFKRA